MKMFDADKTRMIELPYGKIDYDDILSRFHLIPERHGQTDGQTELLYIHHHHHHVACPKVDVAVPTSLLHACRF